MQHIFCLRFLKTKETKIPKVVHFIWLGPRPFPPQSVENVRTWIAHNPDWEFKFWTDRRRDPPCNGMETIVMKEYPFPLLGNRYVASENWGGATSTTMQTVCSLLRDFMEPTISTVVLKCLTLLLLAIKSLLETGL